MIYFRLVLSYLHKDHAFRNPTQIATNNNHHQQQQQQSTCPQPCQLKSNKPQSRVGYSAMPIQIDIQRWRPGRMIEVEEDHHAIKCKVLGIQIVLQCHKDIYEGGKASAGYKTWYSQEYRRVVKYLALRGHPKAQRAVVKSRELKQVWQQRRRAQANIIGAFQRYIEAEAQERFQELD